MKVKRIILIWTIIISYTHALIIPWNLFKSKNVVKDIENFTDAFSLGPGLKVTKAEVDQLILFLENATNSTGSELASRFLSQNYAIAITFSKFWKSLIQSILSNNNGSLLEIIHGFDIQEWLNGVCCKPVSQEPLNPSKPQPSKAPVPVPVPSIFADVDKDASSIKFTFNLPAKDVSAMSEKSYPKFNMQQLDSTLDPELSYETLQKWIADYGLSASSLRDYLETYLFAGDRPWTASLATLGSENESYDEALVLTKRLAILGANINLALTQRSGNDDEEEEVASKGEVKLKKRSIDSLPDYSSLVYSFSRLDMDMDMDNQSEPDDVDVEYDFRDEVFDISDRNLSEENLLDSKHRVFDNDEIVSAISAQGFVKKTARSKDYKQVIYDDQSTEKRIYKREDTMEKKAEEDCVPVTWYNVFHHSVFGKYKFCHV